MGQVAFGYPSSIIGVTLAQPAFLLYMKLITPEGLLTANANGLIGKLLHTPIQLFAFAPRKFCLK